MVNTTEYNLHSTHFTRQPLATKLASPTTVFPTWTGPPLSPWQQPMEIVTACTCHPDNNQWKSLLHAPEHCPSCHPENNQWKSLLHAREHCPSCHPDNNQWKSLLHACEQGSRCHLDNNQWKSLLHARVTLTTTNRNRYCMHVTQHEINPGIFGPFISFVLSL